MFYYSTRDSKNITKHISFSEVVLNGLAPDGGLYLPKQIPDISEKLIDWQKISYHELAFEIISLFADDIPAPDLKEICRKAYTSEVFKYVRNAENSKYSENADEITPFNVLGEMHGSPICLLAVSNGPTLAFKDMAMQFLGQLFEYILKQRQQKMTILGATSGDTGSAAEYALRGKKNIELFMLSPHEKMSPFQQAQMYHLTDKNIHNITVEGFFHHCQDLVKQVSSDLNFKNKYNLSTVNSINWARIVAQIVYYVKAYLSAVEKLKLNMGDMIDVCVPSGNFGNICAAYFAKKMGVPIRHLICASNENNILADFFATGIYKVRDEKSTTQTSSPSMDIAKSSNLERLIFDALIESGVNQTQAAKITQNAFSSTNFDFKMHQEAWQYIINLGFIGGCSKHANRLEMIQLFYQQFKVVIDPHTADGAFVALEFLKKQHLQKNIDSFSAPTDQTYQMVPMILIETAQGTKFEDTIFEALGFYPKRHTDFMGLEDLPKHFNFIKGDPEILKAFIEKSLADA